MTVHLSVAARRAALMEHSLVCSREAAMEACPFARARLLRDARDMMASALALETEEPAA